MNDRRLEGRPRILVNGKTGSGNMNNKVCATVGSVLRNKDKKHELYYNTVRVN
jgi:hypothetical protein